MQTIYNDNNVKKYFLLSQNLSQKADEIGSELGLNFSELVRKALENFINEIEREKIEKQIEDACQFYYNVDKEIAADMRASEGEI